MDKTKIISDILYHLPGPLCSSCKGCDEESSYSTNCDYCKNYDYWTPSRSYADGLAKRIVEALEKAEKEEEVPLKKYELTDEVRVAGGETLHRIRALRDFGLVKAGDLGGWIQHEGNLSHDGDCWVFDEAMVFDDAKVWGNATIRGSARVCSCAEVYGDAMVMDTSAIEGHAKVSGRAVIMKHSSIYHYARVFGDVMFGPGVANGETVIGGGGGEEA